MTANTKRKTAHEMRNRVTKQFQAVTGLVSEHRWCLTGTPIQNSLEDLSSLVSFLRVPLLENPATFRKYIISEDKTGTRHRFRNLRLLLSSICLRRTKQVAGLLEPIAQMRELYFTQTERQDYESLLDRIEKRIDLGVSGHAGNSRGSPAIFQAMLQLRLFCNHGRIYASSSTENNLEDALDFLQQNDEANCVFCSRPIYSINDRPDTDGGHLITPCTHLTCRLCHEDMLQKSQSCPSCAAGDKEMTVQKVLDRMRMSSFEDTSSYQQATRQLPDFPSKLLTFVEDISQQTYTKRQVKLYRCFKR